MRYQSMVGTPMSRNIFTSLMRLCFSRKSKRARVTNTAVNRLRAMPQPRVRPKPFTSSLPT